MGASFPSGRGAVGQKASGPAQRRLRQHQRMWPGATELRASPGWESSEMSESSSGKLLLEEQVFFSLSLLMHFIFF